MIVDRSRSEPGGSWEAYRAQAPDRGRGRAPCRDAATSLGPVRPANSVEHTVCRAARVSLGTEASEQRFVPQRSRCRRTFVTDTGTIP